MGGHGQQGRAGGAASVLAEQAELDAVSALFSDCDAGYGLQFEKQRALLHLKTFFLWTVQCGPG
ncbi:MAG TPA: hypothetical protein DIT89_05290 [Planctomycetaceae bacterium]|nr:hypothetical protein [Planctomycetaceae bacterium]